MSLRLAFLGSPDFAVPSLQALARAGHEIAAVYTQPPRPAGRGQHARPSPVHSYAATQGWPVYTPTSLKNEEAQADFASRGFDAAVVVAYGLILPMAILRAPRFGCLNVHASLLPRWRGAAPIQRAILSGDRETGISIMMMDEGLDTGPILLQEAVTITTQTRATELHDTLAALGARMIVEALNRLTAGKLTPQPQPEEGVTYAAKLTRAEGRLDWRQPAAELERRVRAFTPWPGAWCQSGDERLKILGAELADNPAGAGPSETKPGQLLDNRFTVACGDGALRLTVVQPAGKKPMSGEEYLRGHPVVAETLLP